MMTSTEELNGMHCYCRLACALAVSSVVRFAVIERLGTVQKIFVRQLVVYVCSFSSASILTAFSFSMGDCRQLVVAPHLTKIELLSLTVHRFS